MECTILKEAKRRVPVKRVPAVGLSRGSKPGLAANREPLTSAALFDCSNRCSTAEKEQWRKSTEPVLVPRSKGPSSEDATWAGSKAPHWRVQHEVQSGCNLAWNL